MPSELDAVVKRRVTVLPVDDAFLSTNGRHIVVSLNGADRVRTRAVPTEDPDEPVSSRVLCHSYHGVLEVDVTLHERDEYVVNTGVNHAGVVACFVCPLPSTHRFARLASAAPRRSARQHILFLAGRQRLAEHVVPEDVWGGGESWSTKSVAQLKEGAQGFPLQCFRAYGSVDVAVLVTRPDLVCTWSASSQTMQRLRLEASTVAAIGPGREGRSEVTLLLSDQTISLYGLRGATGTTNPAPSAQEEEDEEQKKSPVSGLFNVRVMQQQQQERQGLSRVKRAASQLEELQLTTIGHLPAPPTTTARVQQLVWAGLNTLWVVYTDGHVKALWWRGGATATAPLHSMTVVYDGQVGDGVVENLHCCPDARSPSLHYCYRLAASDTSTLHYGTLRLRSPAGTNPPEAMNGGIEQTAPFGDAVYGIRFDSGRYHVLSQSREKDGPLFVTTFRGGPQTASAAARARLPPAQQILQCPESHLSAQCAAIDEALNRMLVSGGQSEADLASQLSQLVGLQDSVYALLKREAAALGSAPLPAASSQPHRLQDRVNRRYMELTVLLFLCRVGALEGVEQPLVESLELHAARTAAAEAQNAVKAVISDAFRASAASDVAGFALWPAKGSLCVDVLVACLGYQGSDAAVSLLQILAAAPSGMSTALMQLVLYYSYRTLRGAPDAATQQRQHQLREAFLAQFNQPTSLNVWCFAAYAVDHGLNPAAETAVGEAAYTLGRRVGQLGSPPTEALLAPIVHGLVQVGAFDVAARLSSTCLATYSGTPLPPAVGLKLLFLALHCGDTWMVESLYRASRDTALETIATQGLAHAALQTGSVRPLRGFVAVDSPQAKLVEGVLISDKDVARRSSVLLQFYILMQRFEEALEVCMTAAASGAVPAQRAQVVASYLRSLLPEGTETKPTRPLFVDASSSSSSFVHRGGGAALVVRDGGARNRPLTTFASVAPTLLENNAAEVREQVRRTEVRCTPALARGAGGGGLGLLSFAAPAPYPGGGSPDLSTVLRPSALLSSLDRNGSGGASASPLPSTSAPPVSSTPPPPADGESTLRESEDASLLDTREVTLPPGSQNEEERAGAGLSFGGSTLCEARLQRSGRMCGRNRPCPYHDKKTH